MEIFIRSARISRIEQVDAGLAAQHGRWVWLVDSRIRDARGCLEGMGRQNGREGRAGRAGRGRLPKRREAGNALRTFNCSHTAYLAEGERVDDPSLAFLRVSVRLVTLRVVNTFALSPAGDAEGRESKLRGANITSHGTCLARGSAASWCQRFAEYCRSVPSLCADGKNRTRPHQQPRIHHAVMRDEEAPPPTLLPLHDASLTVLAPTASYSCHPAARGNTHRRATRPNAVYSHLRAANALRLCVLVIFLPLLLSLQRLRAAVGVTKRSSHPRAVCMPCSQRHNIPQLCSSPGRPPVCPRPEANQRTTRGTCFRRSKQPRQRRRQPSRRAKLAACATACAASRRNRRSALRQ